MLEGVQQRTLPLGQVEPGGSRLADRLENLLEKLELVGCEGVIPYEIIRVPELREGCAGILEGQLILKDVTLPGVLLLQARPVLPPAWQAGVPE